MRHLTRVLHVALWLFSHALILADPVITFFFREYPQIHITQETIKKLTRPQGIAKYQLNQFINLNPVSGMFCTYFGFLNRSNQNGQIQFPRKLSKASFTLVITSKIVPIMMFQNTISHWELEPGIHTERYSVELKHDEQTKFDFWDTQKLSSTESYISSTDSIIIIAKPSHLYVPTGIVAAQPGANLLLPDIYVKKGINTLRNALYVLNLAPFFRPIDLFYKKEKTKFETLVKE